MLKYKINKMNFDFFLGSNKTTENNDKIAIRKHAEDFSILYKLSYTTNYESKDNEIELSFLSGIEYINSWINLNPKLFLLNTGLNTYLNTKVQNNKDSIFTPRYSILGLKLDGRAGQLYFTCDYTLASFDRVDKIALWFSDTSCKGTLLINDKKFANKDLEIGIKYKATNIYDNDVFAGRSKSVSLLLSYCLNKNLTLLSNYTISFQTSNNVSFADVGDTSFSSLSLSVKFNIF